MIRRLWTVVATVLLALAGGAVVAPGVASADPYPYVGCHWEYDTTYYAYDAGSYKVSAAEWHLYGNPEITPDDPCVDINVEIANTGGMTIRTQVCPYPGQTWSCYSMGWGALAAIGPTYGVTLHSYHMPCSGACVFYWRLETASQSIPSGVAENIKVTY